MKPTLLFLLLVLSQFGFSQANRQEVESIGFIEVKFKDSSGTYIMMWDDFTFSYGENFSEIIMVEGGSNRKVVFKAKHIDFITFLNDSVRVELHRYKSPRGRSNLLLQESHKNGDYSIYQSPGFVEPVFYYIGFQGEVFSLLPNNNEDFLQFFGCDQLYEKFGAQESAKLTLKDMKSRMNYYLKKCLPKDQKKEEKIEDVIKQ